MSSPLGLRSFAGGAPFTELTSPINTTALSLAVQTIVTANWPNTAVGPFVAILDFGLPTQESVLVSAVTTTSMTIPSGGRAIDGGTAQSHGVGCTVWHGPDAASMQDVDQHVYDITRDDHTQYLKKSLMTSKGDLISASAASTPVRIAVGANGTFMGAVSGLPAFVDHDTAILKRIVATYSGPFTTGVFSPVPFGTVVESVGTWNNSTSPHGYVVPSAGLYLVLAEVTSGDGGSAALPNLQGAVLQNGSIPAGAWSSVVGTGGEVLFQAPFGALVIASAADVIGAECWHAHGSDETLNITMTIVRLSS